MMRIGFMPKGVPGVVVYALALVLVWTTSAYAQSAADQYATPTPPSGPAAGEPVIVVEDTTGQVDAGDVLWIPGDYAVADGASVVFEDADGTQGTLVDGVNADMVVGEGGIEVTVAGDPINVVGGDGVLNTAELTVVATTGIS